MNHRFFQHFTVFVIVFTDNKHSLYTQVHEVYPKWASGTRSVSLKSQEEWHWTISNSDTSLTTITLLVWSISLQGEYL